MTYDEQIENLISIWKNKGVPAFRRALEDEWIAAKGLFKFIPSSKVPGSTLIGCLTQIKTIDLSHYPDNALKSIALEIQRDDRIPKYPAEILPSHLSLFKEYQERVDAL